MSVDWKNWVFCERSIVKTSFALESLSSSVFESSAASLDFDNFLNVSHSTGASYFDNEESLDQRPIQLNLNEVPAPCSTMSANKQLTYDLSKNLEVVHISYFKLDVFCPFSSLLGFFDPIIRVFVSIIAVFLFMSPCADAILAEPRRKP